MSNVVFIFIQMIKFNSRIQKIFLIEKCLVCIAVSLLFFIGFSCRAQDSASSEFTVLFYNVENLFDTKNDSLKRDGEFTPEGSKEWTESKLWSKVNTLAKVLIGVESNLPDFIGLSEVENDSVLYRLIHHPLLSSAHYEIIHFESPDLRGIDVAFLYKKDKFDPYFFKNFNVDLQPRPTRDILIVEGTVASGDSVRFYVNHWPSRYGGKQKSIPKRVEVANKMLHVADSLQNTRNLELQIAMGDFNDEVKDSSLQLLIKQEWSYASPNNYTSDIKGTYKYRSHWGQYDAFLIHGKAMNYQMKVAVMEWLFEEDERYGGLKVNRSFKGNYFNGGPSDHLPIILNVAW